MNKERWIALGAALIMIAGTAGYLAALKNRQRVGNPGLKMVQDTVLYEEKDAGNALSTNAVVTSTVALPTRILNCPSELLPVKLAEKDWLPKDTVFGRRRYRVGAGSQIDISVVLMGRDRTSIHKPEICLTGQGWTIEKRELSTIPIARPRPCDLEVMRITAAWKPSGQTETYKAVYVYWFVSENHLTARHSKRVWWMAKDLVTTGVLQRWAYVTYLSFCHAGQEEATFERMKEFIAASVPEFQLVSGPPLAAHPPDRTTAAALN